MSRPEQLSLREQAYNRLTLAAGFFMMTGASIYVAVETEPIPGTIAAAAIGAMACLYTKQGLAELTESRQNLDVPEIE
jgi:hypothetical protein